MGKGRGYATTKRCFELSFRGSTGEDRDSADEAIATQRDRPYPFSMSSRVLDCEGYRESLRLHSPGESGCGRIEWNGRARSWRYWPGGIETGDGRQGRSLQALCRY